MSIVLLILKILGITLLAIILLVLLILAALLFCAFKYEITADGDKDGPTVHALVKVRWLFRIVCFQYLFDKTPDGAEDKNGYILKVFGIPVKKAIKKPGDDDSGDEDKEEAEGDNTSGDKPDSGGAEAEPEAEESKPEGADSKPEASSDTNSKPGSKPEAEADEKPEARPEAASGKPGTSVKPSEEAAKPEEGAKPEEKPEGSEEEITEASGEEDGEKPKGKLSEKIKGIKDKVSKKVTDLLESFEALLILLRKKKGLLEKYITKKSTKKAIKKAWKVLVWVLKHICPKKYSGSLTFGLDDPSLTGEICAAISPWYILIADRFALTPSFEGKLVASGDVYLKGRIRLWGFLTRGISLYRDKNIRKVIDEAKKVKETIMETPDEAKEIFAGAA